MSNEDMLIDIIDSRIENYIKRSNLINRNIGEIISLTERQTARVKIIGFDTVFTFPYRDYLVGMLKEGDSVLIEGKIGNLSNSIITDRFYGEE